MSEPVVQQEQVRRWRWAAHQLDAGPGSAASPADVAILDLGVQETGPIGALWSLACRGLPDPGDRLEEELFSAWTLRGAPHLYRRSDLREIAAATAPYDEDDAARRIFDAATPLRRNGIAILDELRTIAGLQREAVREPVEKGVVSTTITAQLEPHSLRECRPCNATHAYEQPFRISALQGGLELVPGTSPAVMRRVPRLRAQLFAERRRDPAFDPVRGYLRFYGPARPAEVAGYVDGAVASVKRHWPDTAQVRVEGLPGVRHVLPEDLGDLLAGPPERAGVVRLLGPFDPYLQLRDRELLVADKGRRNQVWRILGRPGVVAVDGDVIGIWRPKSAGRKLTVRLGAWGKPTKSVRAAIEREAELLAAQRDQQLAGVVDEPGLVEQ